MKPKRPAAKKPAGTPPAPIRRRQLPPGSTERIVSWITTDIATRLRVAAARRRLSLSAIVEEALTAHLPPDN